MASISRPPNGSSPRPREKRFSLPVPNLHHLVRAVSAGFFCFVFSGCVTGVFSGALIENTRKNDPEVSEYHAAYLHPDGLVLEYAVETEGRRWNAEADRFLRYTTGGERYWAVLHFDEIQDSPAKRHYTIHRIPLTEKKKERMVEVPLLPLDPEVVFYEYIDRLPADTLPQVFVTKPPRPRFYVRYRSPDSWEIEIYQNGPRELYIPAASYPILIGLYPFALVGDILTYPVVPFLMVGW